MADKEEPKDVKPEDLSALPRADLQALAKKHGIKANQASAMIIEQLEPVLRGGVAKEPEATAKAEESVADSAAAEKEPAADFDPDDEETKEEAKEADAEADDEKKNEKETETKGEQQAADLYAKGYMVEALFDGYWYKAEVLEKEDADKVKVKFDVDSSEVSVKIGDIRKIQPANADKEEDADMKEEEQEKSEESERRGGTEDKGEEAEEKVKELLDIGNTIEALFEGYWYRAKILEKDEDGKVKVKFDIDDSEVSVKSSDIRKYQTVKQQEKEEEKDDDPDGRDYKDILAFPDLDRISDLSGADVSLSKKGKLKVFGASEESRKLVDRYVKLFELAYDHKDIPLVDAENASDKELTVVEIPPGAQPQILGRRGAVLRRTEKEFKVLTFMVSMPKKKEEDEDKDKDEKKWSKDDIVEGYFEDYWYKAKILEVEESGKYLAKFEIDDSEISLPEDKIRKPGEKSKEPEEASEFVGIFGSASHRINAEVRFLSIMSQKCQEHVEAQFPEKATTEVKLDEKSDDGFGMTTRWLDPQDMPVAIGKGGSMRKKIARVSGCIVEYGGRVAIFVGPRSNRAVADKLMTVVLNMRKGTDSDDKTQMVIDPETIPEGLSYRVFRAATGCKGQLGQAQRQEGCTGGRL